MSDLKTRINTILMPLCLMLILSHSALSQAAGTATLAKINDFKALSNDEEVRVVLKVAGALKEPGALKKIADKTAQIDIAGSYTEPAKRNYDVSASIIENVDIYQLDPQTVRIRLSLNETFDEALSTVWISNSNLILSIKKALATPSPVIEEESAPMEDAFSSIFAAEEEIDTTGETDETPVEEVESRPVIKMVSALFLVTGLFLVVAYIVKEKALKRGAVASSGMIRVLDRSYIDMKKSVMVIDVAGERLVIGSSGENLTFLTKLEKQAAPDKGAKKPPMKETSFSGAVKKAVDQKDSQTQNDLMSRIKKLKPIR